MSPVNRQRVKAIFADAIEKHASQRAEFIDRMCGDEPTVRVEVLRLLSLHETQDTTEHPTEHPTAVSAPAPVSLIGQTIGRYKLLQLIGEGGFGSVYMAEQQEPVRRTVALKIIKLGMDTKQVIARFDAERQALAMMDHPNIARVLDAGATETGRPYFVMDLVKGVPITEYCDRNNLSTTQRLKLFVDVCSAVQHAHQKGIIHRDIKPSNVMVTMHDGRPVVKVIDFGIAKATDHRLTEKTLFTEYRQFIGTPQYMSPEQAEMSGLDIDTRADIYSLGVLLYELLTGTTPFSAQQLRSAAYGEIQRMIREVEPPKPSTRISTLGDLLDDVAKHRASEPAKLNRDVRGDLDWITMKALEKDRTRRYEAASAMAADIERYLSNRPVEAGPPTVRYRLKKFVRRNRAALATAGALALALVIALFAVTYGLIQARHGRDAALASQKIATAEKEKAQQVSKFLEEMLANVGPMRAQGRDTTILREILDTTLQRVDQELKNQPRVRAEILAVIGQTYRELAQYEQAEKLIRESLELRRRALGDGNPETIESLNLLANALLDQGKFAEAEPLLKEVIAARKAALGTDDMQVAQALNDLSYVHQVQHDFDDAIRVQQEVLRIVRKNVHGDHTDLAASLNHMAQILQNAGKYDEADPYAQEGLEMRRRLFGENHSETALSLERIAFGQQVRGQFVEAEKTFREIYDIRRKVFGEDHPDTTNAKANIAWSLTRQHKFAEAERLFREVLESEQRTIGKDHPSYAVTVNNLAGVLRQQGKFAEAEPYYRDALAVRTRLYGPDHPSTVESMIELAVLLRDLGRFEESADLAQQAADTCRQTGSSQDQTRGFALFALGQTLLAQKDWTNAERTLSESVALRRKFYPENSTVMLSTEIELARALQEQDRFSQAEAILLQLPPPATRPTSDLDSDVDQMRQSIRERLASLYEAWGKPAEAARWREQSGSSAGTGQSN